MNKLKQQKTMEKLTKNQVLELIRHAEGLLISNNGGEGYVHYDELSDYADYLSEFEFLGLVEPTADIYESPLYCPEWGTYKFSDPENDTTDGHIYVNIGAM